MKEYRMQEGGQQQPTPEEMAMMQQQQAQQGAAPQQGAPQGQDPAMQQMMQMVQQMIQQGAQPADIAAELLGQQVPPEAIMQVFVEMGLPEQEAQAAIQQAMQGGPAQEGAPQGQPSPEEMAAMQQQQGQQPMMQEGGLIGDQAKLDVDGDGKLSKSDFASLRQAEYGDDVKESINRLQRKTITQLYPTPTPAPEPFKIDDLPVPRAPHNNALLARRPSAKARVFAIKVLRCWSMPFKLSRGSRCIVPIARKAFFFASQI